MTDIPLHIQPDAEEPGVAEVYVDGWVGERAYRFLLDTGAGRSSLPYDAYSATFPPVDSHRSSGVFAGGANDVIEVPRLTVGPMTRAPFEITRGPAGSAHDRSLIGMDLLRDWCCHFLFDAARLEVSAAALALDAPFHDLRVDAKHHPYVEVGLGAGTASAVWDTGASLTVVDQALIARYPDQFALDGTSTGTDSTGASVETPMYRMTAVEIGGRAFEPARVAAVELAHVNAGLEIPMDLIIGYNLYRQARWLFDFPRRRWAISSARTHPRRTG
jgi:hypothetical protein